MKICTFALFIAALYWPISAHAGSTIGVNGASCAFNSLVDAIAAAERNSTIYITPGTYLGDLGVIDKSLILVPARPDSNCTRESLIADSNDVILDGEGQSQGGNGGLVEITDSAQVTFRHMWLRNATATNGGIIAVTGGATLILDDVLVSDGDAVAAGGLIYAIGTQVRQSQVDLRNGSSVYRGTTANGDGGAVALFGSLLLVKDGNIGITTGDGFSTAGNNGGGIYAFQSEVQLTTEDTLVTRNVAGNQGGGMYLQDSTAIITDASFNNNIAEFSGGGIYVQSGSATLSGVNITDNSTTTVQSQTGGGGVFVLAGELVIDSSILMDNQSATDGGALVAREETTVEIRNNSIISQNSSDFNGGAIKVFGVLSIADSTLSGNSTLGIGGAIQCLICPSLTVVNTIIDGNSAQSGGGISVSGNAFDGGSQVRIEESMITNNTAISATPSFGTGGGLSLANVAVEILATDVEDNTATSNGGGIAIFQGSATTSLLLDQVSLDNNLTLEQGFDVGGAALYANGVDSITAQGGTWGGNESAGVGGVLMLIDSSFSAQSTLIFINFAEVGAGIFASQSNVSLSSLTLGGSEAGGDGGGIYQFGGTLYLDEVQLAFNSAERGAGLYLTLVDATIRNSRVNSNTAVREGAGMFLVAADVQMFGDFETCNLSMISANQYCSELRANASDERGGGVYVASLEDDVAHVLDIRTTAIVENLAPDGGTAIHHATEFASAMFLENVLIAENGTTGIPSNTILISGDTMVNINMSTLAANNDRVIQASDVDSGVQLFGSIVYLNSEGPQVSSGVKFARSCNNSQAVSSPSQDMGGNLGNPAFDGANPDGDYRLTALSPSVDRCLSGPLRDLDGKFRLVDTNLVDQGAFELDGLLMLPDEMFQNSFEGL